MPKTIDEISGLFRIDQLYGPTVPERGFLRPTILPVSQRTLDQEQEPGKRRRPLQPARRC